MIQLVRAHQARAVTVKHLRWRRIRRWFWWKSESYEVATRYLVAPPTIQQALEIILHSQGVIDGDPHAIINFKDTLRGWLPPGLYESCWMSEAPDIHAVYVAFQLIVEGIPSKKVQDQVKEMSLADALKKLGDAEYEVMIGNYCGVFHQDPVHVYQNVAFGPFLLWYIQSDRVTALMEVEHMRLQGIVHMKEGPEREQALNQYMLRAGLVVDTSAEMTWEEKIERGKRNLKSFESMLRGEIRPEEFNPERQFQSKNGAS